MKSLYVSDLDGTLLDSRSRLSDFTVNTINGLIREGMIFSFASARSPYSAEKALIGLDIEYGAVYNGAFIKNMKSGERIGFSPFSPGEAEHIFDIYTAGGVFPAVFSYIDGKEKCTYHRALSSPLMISQREKDREDPRKRAVDDIARMLDGEVFYFSAMGREDEFRPIYDILKAEFECFFYRDHASDVMWLEVLPKGVSKASALKRLAEVLRCERIVAFGDGKNDISLFDSACECYAVANAADELKSIATAVIGSNDDDGVARWLLENFR